MFYKRLVLLLSLLVLASCGGQGSFSGQPNGTYVVSVTVSGLSNLNNLTSGSFLKIQSNASELTFTGDGTQSFPYQSVATQYNVVIVTQPSPVVCRVMGGSGVNTSSNTINVNVTCAAQYVYVANFNANSLTVFEILGQGRFTPVRTSVPTGTAPSSVVAHPNAPYIYVANQGDNTIGAYQITNGVPALMHTAIQVQGTALSSGPNFLSISPNGSFLYCSNTDGTISQFRIGVDGSLTQITGAPINVGNGLNSLSVDPSSNYLYATRSDTNANPNVNAIYQFSIQSNGGLQTLDAPVNLAAHSRPTSVAVGPTGQYAYVVNNGANNVEVFPLNAGALGSPLSPPILVDPYPHAIALAVTPNGTYAYVSNYGLSGSGNTLSQLRVDPTSGALSAINSSVQLNVFGPYAVAVDGSGYGVFVSNYHQNDAGTLSELLIASDGSLPNAPISYGNNGILSQPQSIAIH